jgi:hypothetical protein
VKKIILLILCFFSVNVFVQEKSNFLTKLFNKGFLMIMDFRMEKGLIENTDKLIRQYIPKKLILIHIINNKSKKYNIKLITDTGKN